MVMMIGNKSPPCVFLVTIFAKYNDGVVILVVRI